MSINKRIKEIRDNFCEGQTKNLAAKLGVSSQAVSNYLRDGYNIGREVIENLLSKFPDINANWLLMGKGDMTKTDSVEKPIDVTISREVWEVIQSQAKSLAKRDDQIDELIKILMAQKGVAAGVKGVASKAAHG